MTSAKNAFLLFALLLSVAGIAACGKSSETPLNPNAISPLSNEEIDMLQYMREEEKLARDVYQYFYDQYGLNMFKNIRSSEQTHMDAVLNVMKQFGIPDISHPTPGMFNHPELQTLYNSLIAQGKTSLVDALTVGATIEDVDIRDLGIAVSGTTNTTISSMYQKLECGSGNHLRAFAGNLSSQGVTYTPQFISAAQYQEILNSEQAHCGQ